jgi:serine/threonine-protein kinase HipA
MNRSGKVYIKTEYCGIVSETDEGYSFVYDDQYLQEKTAQAVSCTLPLTKKPYTSKTLFAFFETEWACF